MFLSSLTEERLAAIRGTALWPPHFIRYAPLGHLAPGSLSQRPNRQEGISPGSFSRRVVPWGEVSSWVKGAE